MATANGMGLQRQAIATAIAAELQRQGENAGRIDVDALTDAVERALEPSPPITEGKRPNELNSTNDD